MPETPTPVSVPETSPAPQPFAERLSDGLQHMIQVVVGAHRKPPRRLKSLLHGTWLGHPLHPAITDVPITAWITTAVFDVFWLISPVAFAWAARGAEVTVLIGLLAALGAIVTGLTDWSDTYGAERRVGLVVNDRVYLCSADGVVSALQTSTGSLLWQYTILGFVFETPVVDGGSVYVGSGNGIAYALRARDGALLWYYLTKVSGS